MLPIAARRTPKETTNMLPLKLIVVPIDFSGFSKESLNVAKERAKQYGSEITRIHVVPVIPKLPDTVAIFEEGKYEQELIQRAERKLQEMQPSFSGRECGRAPGLVSPMTSRRRLPARPSLRI
jgi:hypothetical protein